ncbi:MAG: hypothetical protein A2901_00460 [Elusimicrobia bacterium RIFCSPLOWO2_01_FULL_54_10]|nr:MAG: hypothetical protein A2901_00460 [Elusimicrobia bacterium RIFCSPLOWO2_01_FULL_54_10]
MTHPYINKICRRYFYILIIVGVIFVNFTPSPAFAVRPDSLKDTLSDSRPSVASNHEIVLNLSGTTTFIAGETVVITFNASFDLTTLTMTDADFQNGATDETLQSGACGATDTIRFIYFGGESVSFMACDAYTAEAAGTAITIQLGSNAAGGTTRIVNPTAAVYTLTVAGTHGDDSQDTILVITAAVTVSATIDEVLTLTVAAVIAGSCTTTGGTTVTSTSTTIPYGTIATEAFYDVCQQLTVATNAGGGYTVTVYTVAGLDSGANAFAVGSGDGGATLTLPNTWATATNNGYALCMDDTTGNAAATANAGWDTAAEECGGAGQKFELIADLSGSQTPSTIMSSAAGVSSDVSLAGWRISADAAQAAGAYTGTADYITTGTF